MSFLFLAKAACTAHLLVMDVLLLREANADLRPELPMDRFGRNRNMRKRQSTVSYVSKVSDIKLALHGLRAGRTVLPLVVIRKSSVNPTLFHQLARSMKSSLEYCI